MKVLKNTIFTIKNEGRAGLILKAGSHLWLNKIDQKTVWSLISATTQISTQMG